MNSKEFKQKLGVPVDTLRELEENVQEMLNQRGKLGVHDFIVLNDFIHFLNKLIKHIDDLPRNK